MSKLEIGLYDSFNQFEMGMSPVAADVYDEHIYGAQAAEQMGFPLNHDCGGNASCTTCRVDVVVGLENLSDIDFDEQDLLDREALTEPYRRLGPSERFH